MASLRAHPALLALVAIVILPAFFAAGPPSDEELTSKLLGTWESGFRETEWGTVKFTYVFSKPNILYLTLTPEENPQDPSRITGTFSIRGGKLVSTIESDEMTLDFTLDGDSLELRMKGEDPLKLKRVGRRK